MKITRTIEHDISPSELIDLFLADRGITDSASFLNPTSPKDLIFSDFFENKKEFEKNKKLTLKLLRDIKKSGRTIVVYCDYDADGITGGAILWETLNHLGFSVMPYIPDRKTEGYGFSKKGIDAVITKHDPALIISVDHGIVGHSQIEYAKEKGVKVIITDHHQKADTNPPAAYAIFHTSKLSGSGVSYFFSREIARELGADTDLLTHFESDFLALAAIGTIADLVPLVGPSRAVAKYGLAAFATVQKKGLKALLKECALDGKMIKTYEVGFMIAPRINAFGRLEHGMDALRLLCTKSLEKAVLLAKKANMINSLRQDLVKKACDEALEMVDPEASILIVAGDSWEEGIMGLIAGKIVQKYGKPAIVKAKNGTMYKASARAPEGYDLISFLRNSSDQYLSIGGHPGAAGFSIEVKKYKKFVTDLQKNAKKEFANVSDVGKTIDLQIPLSLATTELALLLETLEPFGMGHQSPLFMSVGRIVNKKLMGKNSTHMKLWIADDAGGALEVMHFNVEKKQSDDYSKDSEISFVYNLESNTWGGRTKAVGKIVV